MARKAMAEMDIYCDCGQEDAVLIYHRPGCHRRQVLNTRERVRRMREKRMRQNVRQQQILAADWLKYQGDQHDERRE
jgi:hypothetical protein